MLKEMLLAAPISEAAIYTVGDKNVHARKLTGLEVIEAKLTVSDDATEAERQRSLAKLIIAGACDSEGTRIFADDDLEAVLKMPYEPFMRLVNGVMNHNGMGDTAKNSSTPSTDAS